LRTFKTDLKTTFSIKKDISDPRITVVSESGIDSGFQIKALREAEIDCVLVGEALMKTADPAVKIKDLLEGKSALL
jgi:indole-3-glycerol phosphate synthase